MINKEDLKQHRLWCFGKGGVQINRAGYDLFGSNLRGAYLSKANLRDANLTDANLIGANLSKANLRDAHLTDANLRGANLSDANLTDANLTDANLTGANLTGANLAGSDLRGASLSEAIGIAPLEAQITEAKRIYSLLQIEGNLLEMDDWHTCETTHCIAGWSCPDNPNPGAEASRKMPLIARFFFSENDIAEQALYLLGHGLIAELNNLKHTLGRYDMNPSWEGDRIQF